MALKPDKTYTANGVKVNEYLLTNHNPNGIDMPGKRTGLVGITVHNTDKISVSGTTMSEQYTRATVNGNMGDVRVHFYVDDIEAWQNLPLDWAGWHAADGNGDGNMKTIAIECIMDGSGSTASKKAEENCARLVAYLVDKMGLTDKDIYSHNHWYAKKYCPAYILPHWDSFLKSCSYYRKEAQAKIKANERDVLETSGYSKKNDNTYGCLALKELLLIAKELKLHSYGMDENYYFGDGTERAVNYTLDKWKYKPNGVAGEKFIKHLKADIVKAIKALKK